MRLFLRTLLIWMVVLAIPAKGIAASTMLLCGPSHHRMQQAAVEQTRHMHAQHDASAAAMHEHAAAQAHGQADLPSLPDAKAAEPGKLTDLGGYKCGACTSCCSAVALPSDMPSLVTAEAGSEAIGSLPESAPPFLTDGPERPPRNILA